LRYYDEIGLLRPARLGQNGYRYYEQEQLLRLQRILLMRELGMELGKIAEVINNETDPAEALDRHHRRLLDERSRLDNLVATVVATADQLRKGNAVTPEDLFDKLTPERASYLSSLPKKRVAAGMLFSDAANQVLLVKPTYRSHWQLPGGVAAQDESPVAAAVRAVERELGLIVEPGALLVVDWVGPRAGSIEGLLFVYEGPVLASSDEAAIVLPPHELSEWGWFASDTLADVLPAHMLRRISSALKARNDGATRYLEHGALV
jgi:DNA-binding transcriptional MerR regulator/ADP-ribose pyrophosphatase YjhB (NUDIX family)